MIRCGRIARSVSIYFLKLIYCNEHFVAYIFIEQDQEGFKGMGFVIKKIVVHSEPTRLRGGEAHYNMIREKWDVRNLLEVK